MNRYINAKKVMEEINRIGGHNLCEWDTIGVKALIDRQPTADVVEVRHGRWVFINQATSYLEPPYGDTFKCSLCEFVIDISEGNYKYCPECGAKMDGERSEGDD